MRKPFIILVCILLSSPFTFATDNYPLGARATALSNSYVSLTDVWSTFHNQAALSSVHSFSAGVFFESRFLVDELSLAATSVVLPTKQGNLGFSFSQLGEGTFKEHKIGLAYSRKLSAKLNAAIQFDYFSKRFPENEKAVGFPTFEIGITHQTIKELCLGFHVFNPIKNGFETPLGKQNMPAIYRLGGHYQFSDLTLLTAEVEKNTNHPVLVKTGLEFYPVQNLALRFGVSGKPIQYSAGFGYRFGKITTDIAFSYHGNLGFSPSVSLQYNLK